MFIRPGMSHLPFIEMTLALDGTFTDPAAPTFAIRSPSMRTTAFWIAGPPSTATTVPPTNAMTTADVPVAPGAAGVPAACADTGVTDDRHAARKANTIAKRIM